MPSVKLFVFERSRGCVWVPDAVFVNVGVKLFAADLCAIDEFYVAEQKLRSGHCESHAASVLGFGASQLPSLSAF